jgi:RNA polymerase sigma-70 factor (ECF subfamily)
MEWRQAQGNRARTRIELMRRVQAGDREAYALLLGDLRPLLRAMLRRWGVPGDDLDDVHQECLLALHGARRTYQPPRPVEPWLLAIARRVAWRQTRIRLARLASETPVAELPEHAAEPAAADVEVLEQALRALPPQQREAFEMLKFEGLTVEAAAQRAGTTSGALRVRAHRAYRAIKARLRKDDRP